MALTYAAIGLGGVLMFVNVPKGDLHKLLGKHIFLVMAWSAALTITTLTTVPGTQLAFSAIFAALIGLWLFVIAYDVLLPIIDYVRKAA